MFRRFVTITGAIAASVFGTLLAFAEPAAEHISSFRWESGEPDFGGFSGFEIGSNGLSFVTVGDDGIIAHGTLNRTGDNHLIDGVADFSMVPLKTIKGGPVLGIDNDAEGLAIDAKGQIFVSFEGFHRVRRYEGFDQSAAKIAPHKDFKGMQNNSSLEALAVDELGNLYTLPERSGHLERPFPVYRFRNGHWDKPFEIRRAPPFFPVGADIGPDGKFYLLERHLTGIFGFQSRVRRFDFDGDKIWNEETIFTSATGQHDNLEGLAVWRDGNDDIRLTMISDDNFKSFQQTEIVEYRITE